MLLTLYLALLLVVTGIIYSSSTDMQYGSGSIAYAQAQLSQFYNAILMLLAGVVSFVTPALSALAVAGERQRRSLDLVFSAPVSPHYFLVGKLISSVRWVAMLIVLALPVSAVSIVLGGATWLDALGAYVILLSAAAVYSSMAILVSSLAPSPVSAVVLSYLFVAAYAVPMLSMASMFSFRYYYGAYDVPWYAGLSPATAGYAAPASQLIVGVDVPNWILVALASAFITRFLLLGAASALSGYGATETRRLRQWGLVIVGGLVYWLVPPMGFTTGSNGYGMYWGASTAAILMPLILLVPHLVAWDHFADTKWRWDGWFNLRTIWTGAPSGSLPYLLALWAVGFGASAATGLTAGRTLSLEFAVRGGWFLAFLFFWWAVGQYLSGTTYHLRTARLAILAAMLMIGLLPIPILTPWDGSGPGGLIYTLYAPLILTSGPLAGIHTLILSVFGMLVFVAARRNIAHWRKHYGGT